MSNHGLIHAPRKITESLLASLGYSRMLFFNKLIDSNSCTVDPPVTRLLVLTIDRVTKNRVTEV